MQALAEPPATTILEHITREATRLGNEEAEAFRRKLHAFLTDAHHAAGVEMLEYACNKAIWLKTDMSMATHTHHARPHDVRDYAWGTALVYQISIAATARHEKRLTQHILSSLPPAPVEAPTAPSKVAA